MRIDVISYAKSIFQKARTGGTLSDEKETNLAYEVMVDEGNSKITHGLARRILHGLVLMLFSKQNPQRPVK